MTHERLYGGAQEGTRTPTPDKGKRILSPPRLPFRHLGKKSDKYHS